MQNQEAILWAAFSCFVIAFVFFVFIFYRHRRETLFRQKEAELAQQIAEVEMKALRAQMNPHFIFNSLNSVYHFIEINDLQNAGSYLLKVARLMRLVLENSINKSVPLEDDIHALKLYIEVEQMRLQNSFEFSFQIADNVDSSRILVPPLILQPFIENAIWHGLSNRKGNGLLTVQINKNNEFLNYTIEDNGILSTGGSRTDAGNSETVKRKSLGMQITRERIDILNKVKNTKADFTLCDVMDANNIYSGKKVHLKLPLEEL